MNTTSSSPAPSLRTARRIPSRLVATLALAMVGLDQASAQSFTSTSNATAWNTARWNNTTDVAPYGSTYTANNNVSFTSGNYTFAGMGATTNVGNVTLSDNVNVTFASIGSTFATNGAVRTITVGNNSTLDFASQSFSTSAGTGFIKNGNGTLALSGNNYNGGFTLNAGTVVARGNTALGSNATNTLTLNGGTVASNANRSFDNTRFGGGIVIGGNVQFGERASIVSIASDSANLSFANNVNLGAATRAFTIGNNGTNTFSGNITGSAGTGVTINANSGTTGSIVLSGTNTYTGNTTVSSGTLTATRAAALPGYDASGKVIFSGGTLGVQVGGSGWTDTEVNNLLSNATKTSGALGIDTTNGNYTQPVAYTPTNLGTLGLTKLGANTLTLNGTNTYTGVTTISAGTLSVDSINNGGTAGALGNATAAAANLVFDGGTLQYTGANATSNRAFTIVSGKTAVINVGSNSNISLAGATGAATTGNLTKTGLGTLTVTGANTHTGLTSINGSGSGTLVLSGDNTAMTGGVTANTAGTGAASPLLVVNSATALGTGTLTFGGGASSDTVRLDNTSGGNLTLTTNNAFTLNRNFTFVGTNSLDLGNMTTTIAGITAPGARSITVTANTLTFGGAIGATGDIGVTKAGAGTLVLSGTNTYNGTTRVNDNGGTLQIDAAGALPSGSLINLAKAGTNTGTLKLNTSGTNVYTNSFATFASSNGPANGGTPNILNAQGDNTLTGNMIINNGGGNGVNLQSDAGLLTISGNLSNSVVSSTRPFDFGGAGNGVFSGVMSQPVGTALTGINKHGAGTWSVTGTTSSFTGGVNLLQGVLNVASVANTGSNSSIGAGGTINFTGMGTSGTLQYTGSTAMTTNRTVTIAPTGGAIDASGTGSGTLTFTGTFTANNAVGTNVTYVNGSNNATNTGSNFPGTAVGMVISATGLAAGTTITAINGNTYTLSNPFTGASGAVATLYTDNAARTLTLTGSNTGANEISSVMGNSAGGGVLSITKSGTGSWTLSGNNTYTGLTTVSDGSLVIGSSGRLASGNALTVGASGNAEFQNAGQILGAVSNANNATNALNFSATSGTVTLASLTGSGNTTFGSAGTITSGGISGGAVTATGLLTSAVSGGTVSAGSLTGAISGGAITVSGLTTGAISGSGTLGTGSLSSTSVTGGTNNITGAADITTLNGGDTTVGGVATITTLTSGIATLNGGTSAITTLNGGTVNLGSGTVLSVSDGTSAGSIIGTGGALTKVSSGTLTLTGTNGYTGATTVLEGTLIVSGSIASSVTTVSPGAVLTFSGASSVGNITVGSGATFALGTAGAAGTVTINGGTLTGSGSAASIAFTGASVFAPGNSPGTITLLDGGSLTMSVSTVSDFQITDPLFAANSYDLVIGTPGGASESVSFAGTLNLIFSGTGYSVSATAVKLFDVDTYSGSFGTVNVTGLDPGLVATFNSATGYLAIAAIPEPSAYAALAGVGMIGFALYRRRRQNAAKRAA
jgi:autotransporter-associated beta strand protein